MGDPINDGGAAFPLPPTGTGDPRDGMAGGSVGMSLCAWLAGQAMACMGPIVSELQKDLGCSISDDNKEIATRAVQIARAVIAELNETEGPTE